THKVRFKSVGYFIVMIVMTALLVWDISSRSPLQFNVLRDRNQLYSINMDGWVQNVFTLKIQNKSQQAQPYVITTEGFARSTLVGDATITVAAGEVATRPITLAVHPDDVTERVQDVTFVVSSTTGDVREQHVTRFLYE